MLFEPCPGFMTNRPHYFDKWVNLLTGHAVPEGFTVTLVRVARMEGANWAFLASCACLMTDYFGSQVKGFNYWRLGESDTLELAVAKALKVARSEPLKVDSIKTRQAYKAFQLFAAQELGRETGVKVPNVPPVGTPVKPSEPIVVLPDAPEPIALPKPPKPPSEGGWKAPWYVKLFKGTIMTAAVAGVTWLVATVPFLLPFKVWILSVVTTLLEHILG